LLSSFHRPGWLNVANPDRKVVFRHLALVFVAYFVAGRLGLAIPFTSGNVSPVWPPAGIAIAVLLVWGTRMWPAIWLAAFLVNFFTPISHAAALGIAVGNTSSALVANWLLKGTRRFHPSLSRLQSVLAFVLLGTLSTIVAGSIGVSVLNITGVRAWSGFGPAWLIWCLGDAMGVIVVGPLVLCLSQLVWVKKQKLLEFVALVILTPLVSFLVFGQRLGFGLADNVLAFLVFPFVIWAATRFGVAGSAIVSAQIAGVAIWATSVGLGPFVQPDAIRGATLLQVFLAVMSLSGLALAAVVTERKEAEGALHIMQELVRRREQAEQALRSSEQRLSGIVNSAMDAIITIDQSQRIALFNSAAERIFRCTASDAVGSNLDRFIPLRFRGVHSHHIKSFDAIGVTERSMSSPGILYGLRSDGEEFPIEATISQTESEGQKLYTVILRDVTLRRQSEEALMNAEKLSTAGRLAATIAHEINNPLAAITNLIYLVRSEECLTDSARRHLEMADVELRRVAHIAKQTLGFYRDDSSPTRFDPVEVLENILALLANRIKSRHVVVEKEYDLHSEVVGSVGEVRQLFSNIISNAIDAVPTDGHLRIRVSSSLDWRSPVSRGVRITIADNGHGIAQKDRQRIFEPFFTTKKEAGTGLGLWVCRQIVSKHGGSIRVHSRATLDHSGSVFSVFLPITASLELKRIVTHGS
jgi:PAS domain S-box-containing protein